MQQPVSPEKPDTPGKRRIKITVPEYYKGASGEVWEELERYLFEGFLTTHAHILGRTYIFKTLNHIEVRNLEFLRPMRSSPPEVRARFRAAFIAHSIFMIDGENALVDRPRHIRQLMRLVSKLDASWQERIVENLAAVSDRASRLYPLTEVYVHENRSRYKWLQFQAIPVHSVMATGIAGTDEIGMNYCQQTWTALNRVMDKRDDMERDWTHAKFIGSCFNGQGVRQVDVQDKARLDQDRQKIEELKMKVLYRYLNRDASLEDEAPATVSLPNGKTATVAKKFQAITAEELAEQLEAALAGEKDYHDLAVEAQERRIRERAEQIDEQRRKMYAAPIIDGVGGYRILRNEADAKAYIDRMTLLRYDNAQRTKHPIIPELNETSDKPEELGSEKPR